MSHFYICEIR